MASGTNILDTAILPALREATTGLGERPALLLRSRFALGPEPRETRAALAVRFGVSPATVMRWERRDARLWRRQPAPEALQRRLRALFAKHGSRAPEVALAEPWAAGMSAATLRLLAMQLGAWSPYLLARAARGEAVD